MYMYIYIYIYIHTHRRTALQTSPGWWGLSPTWPTQRSN